MAQTLVTGATGFIGNHLVARLVQRGDDVRCLVRDSTPTDRVQRLQELGVKLVRGDTGDAVAVRAAVANTDLVMHLAGVTRAISADHFFAVNERGVEVVAQACAEQTKPPVLIVVSSLAAAGPSSPGCTRNEDQPAAPVSKYGESKLAGERAAERFADGVPTTIIRPPIVLGEWDPSGFRLFSSVSRFGVHLVPTLVASRVSIIHAADLVEALLAAAERGSRLGPRNQDGGPADANHPRQGYYFAADEQQPTYEELGQLIGAAVGRERVRIVKLPKPCLWAVSAVGDLIGRIRRNPGIVNLDKYQEAVAGSWTCSTERIRSEIGFTPLLPLSDRLLQTANWYRRQGWM